MNLTNEEFECIAEQYTQIICDGMDWKTMYQYCYDSMMDFHLRDCSGHELKELIQTYDEDLWEELLDNAKHETRKNDKSQIQGAGLGPRFTDHYKTPSGVIRASPIPVQKSSILGLRFFKKDAIMVISSGGQAFRSNHLNVQIYFFVMFPTFTSTAIESIKEGSKADQVEVTFNGGRSYTYALTDVERFVSELNTTVTANQSVGRYVNNSIKSGLLTAVQFIIWVGVIPLIFYYSRCYAIINP